MRDSYGEGVILGAQCTPSELTRYRIEKKHGQRYWAQRDQLQTL
jgi:murein endopeptidase